MIMSNPYIVSLNLNGFDKQLGVYDNNTVCIADANIKDPNWQRVFEIAKIIWKREFRMSDEDVNRVPLDNSTIFVVYSNDKMGNSNPLSVARFEIYEDHSTGIKTAKIFSMASIIKRKGYGKLLVTELSNFVKTKCNCQFMTVEVTRPIISEYNCIEMLMKDPIEENFWKLEKPTPLEIKEQDEALRIEYGYKPNEIIIVSPRQYKDLENMTNSLEHHDTRLICRNVQSIKRTERVQGLLDFYKQCNFIFQIKPEDSSDTGCYYSRTYWTPWGQIWPFYSYTLVAKLFDPYNVSVKDNIKRLSEWKTYKDLEDNYDSY
jgi:hypothetical protein